TFAAANFHLLDGSTDYSIAPTLIGKFDLGPVKNTVLFGADYDRVAAADSAWSGFAGLIDLSQSQPSFPAYTDPVAVGPFASLAYYDRAHITNAGLMAQWQSTVFERLHLLAGVREAYVDNQLENFCNVVFCNSIPNNTISYDSHATKLLPRFGASYDLTREV